MLRAIKAQPTRAEHAHPGTFLSEVRTPEQSFDPRDDLMGIEGLGDVVVGAKLQPADLVNILDAGGKQYDRRCGQQRVGADRL